MNWFGILSAYHLKLSLNSFVLERNLCEQLHEPFVECIYLSLTLHDRVSNPQDLIVLGLDQLLVRGDFRSQIFQRKNLVIELPFDVSDLTQLLVLSPFTIVEFIPYDLFLHFFKTVSLAVSGDILEEHIFLVLNKEQSE